MAEAAATMRQISCLLYRRLHGTFAYGKSLSQAIVSGYAGVDSKAWEATSRCKHQLAAIVQHFLCEESNMGVQV